jgi:hypothetical protein|tara:strand:- start:95 stop:433 length:339 start_codon:yes stop_codon:yes gene_type:complete
MADQEFRRAGSTLAVSGGTPTTLWTAGGYDTIIGIRLANKTAVAQTADVWISVGGSTTVYLAKTLSISPGASVELVQGGAKIVMQNTDILKAEASLASSIDAYVSIVDGISD